MSDLYRPLAKNAIRNLEHYKRKIQRFNDELIKDIENDIQELKSDLQSTQDYYDVYPKTKEQS